MFVAYIDDKVLICLWGLLTSWFLWGKHLILQLREFFFLVSHSGLHDVTRLTSGDRRQMNGCYTECVSRDTAAPDRPVVFVLLSQCGTDQSVSCRLDISWSRIELSASCYRTCETAGTLQIQITRSGRSADPAYITVQVGYCLHWSDAASRCGCAAFSVASFGLSGGGRVSQTRQRFHPQHRWTRPVWPRWGLFHCRTHSCPNTCSRMHCCRDSPSACAGVRLNQPWP